MATSTTPLRFEQTSTTVTRYVIDWSNELDMDVNEAIVTSVWAPDVLTATGAANTGTTTTVFLNGGLNGDTYVIDNTITTDSVPARTLKRSFRLQICDPIWASNVTQG